MSDAFQVNGTDEYLPLRDVVFNTLRQAILTGEMKPGERLMEIHLANKLGVSRTPIREAIRKLELEGLVVMIPRRGAEVAQITWKNLKDVLEVRRALDVLAVELACDRMRQEELTELGKACTEFKEATRTQDWRKIAAADVRLHDIIVRSTRNDRLIQLVNNLAEQMYRYRMEYLKEPGTHKLLLKEHEAIYSALKKHDKAEAGSAIRIHIENQRRSIISSLRDAGRITEQV